MKITKRVRLLWIIFYLAITGAAINSAYLASVGLSENDALILQFASLIGIVLTAFSCLVGINYWKKQIKLFL